MFSHIYFLNNLKNKSFLPVCSQFPSVSQVHSSQVKPFLVQHQGFVLSVPKGHLSWSYEHLKYFIYVFSQLIVCFFLLSLLLLPASILETPGINFMSDFTAHIRKICPTITAGITGFHF